MSAPPDRAVKGPNFEAGKSYDVHVYRHHFDYDSADENPGSPVRRALEASGVVPPGWASSYDIYADTDTRSPATGCRVMYQLPRGGRLLLEFEYEPAAVAMMAEWHRWGCTAKLEATRTKVKLISVTRA